MGVQVIRFCCMQIVVSFHNPRTGPCIHNVSNNETRFLATDFFVCILHSFHFVVITGCNVSMKSK